MIEPLASPGQVAKVLDTSVSNLAQMRYRGEGPKFVRVGRRKIMYRWSDVDQWIADSVHSSTES